MIRNKDDIKGIFVDNMEFKLSQYVDDTTVILDGSDKSLEETMGTLEKDVGFKNKRAKNICCLDRRFKK
jgi:hypothetical protein